MLPHDDMRSKFLVPPTTHSLLQICCARQNVFGRHFGDFLGLVFDLEAFYVHGYFLKFIFQLSHHHCPPDVELHAKKSTID